MVIAASSGTISFSVADSPTAEVPFSIDVSGTSSEEGTLLVFVLAGSPGCPASASEVQGGDLNNEGSVSGAYFKSVGVERGAGTYTLCGYLTATGSTYATGTATFQVTPAPVPSPTPTKPSPTPAVSPPPPPAPHLAKLTVTPRSRAGRTAAKPGATELLISVTPDAVLHVMLKRHGRTLVERVSFGAHSSGKVVVPWSCSAPGGVYAYTISATDAYGASLSRAGRFRPVSAARCHRLRLDDRRRHREQEAASHRAAEREAREEQSPQHKIKVGEAEYCERVLNGDAEESFTAAGHVYTRCVRVTGEVVIVGEGVVG